MPFRRVVLPRFSVDNAPHTKRGSPGCDVLLAGALEEEGEEVAAGLLRGEVQRVGAAKGGGGNSFNQSKRLKKTSHRPLHGGGYRPRKRPRLGGGRVSFECWSECGQGTLWCTEEWGGGCRPGALLHDFGGGGSSLRPLAVGGTSEEEILRV